MPEARYKVYVAPEARADLADIRQYIVEELQSPGAAANTVNRILRRVRALERFDNAGAPLSAIVGFDISYRYLVCGNYLAFYRVNDNEVFVDRILYGRRDYMRILFGKPEEEL